MTPNLRYQLGAQTDIFHWPADASSPSCSNPSLTTNCPQLHAQTCTKFPLCITLSPNIPNVNFVVRGCMEQILVAKLRIDEKFQKQGCYIVRSKRIYPTLAPLDYIICICSTEYCNSGMQNPLAYTNHSDFESFDLVPIIKAEQLAKELSPEGFKNSHMDKNLQKPSLAESFIAGFSLSFFCNKLIDQSPTIKRKMQRSSRT
uniref:Uncharacterized protein n=1 Tax=Onchocerca volvulus TaxID=6282 RepID=A0A8R1Y519_ONCVO